MLDEFNRHKQKFASKYRLLDFDFCSIQKVQGNGSSLLNGKGENAKIILSSFIIFLEQISPETSE